MNYRNNEDIILTNKRVSPKVQRMADPNEAKAIVTGKGKTRNKLITVLNPPPKKVPGMKTKEEKAFWEEYKNTCDCCGTDISSYKYRHKWLYHIGMCKSCDERLSKDRPTAKLTKEQKERYMNGGR